MITMKQVGTVIFLILLLIIPGKPAFAEDYPGVYASDNALVFVQGGTATGDLTGIVVLTYEYSMDWVITLGETGLKSSDGLILTNGRQYVYKADGARQSESEFISLEKNIDWTTMEFAVLPSYSYYLAPMVQGGLAYAFVETKSGLPTQLVLASEVIETESTINLFDGFLYQLADGQMNAQIAFTETAFGSQGLVRGKFPDNFPPPPENYPNPYPTYPTPSYPPPGGMQPSGSGGGIFFPAGTEVPADQQIDQPRFTLEPVSNYDVPPILKIGIVETRSYADITGWESTCDEFLEQSIANGGKIEVVMIPWDSNKFGGAVMWDRATWLCDEYDVDALMITELIQLEMPGYVGPTGTSRTVRLNGEIRSKIVDGTAGGKIWEGDFELDQNHDVYEIQNGEDGIIRSDLWLLIDMLKSDIDAKGVLDGVHVD